MNNFKTKKVTNFDIKQDTQQNIEDKLKLIKFIIESIVKKISADIQQKPEEIFSKEFIHVIKSMHHEIFLGLMTEE